MMDWKKLLSSKRFKGQAAAGTGRGESPFLLDLDRITFSSFFRRLQDKTQVHPLSVGGRVRSRLTHSIEVASVGRSLGFEVGRRLIETKPDLMPEGITPHDFGYIVQAACLAHDIGNPPFGHAGEEAIGSWFQKNKGWIFDGTITDGEATDFLDFEGNAQGFRILNKLDYYREDGGFRLSYASLGAFTKYPGDSLPKVTKRIEAKKAGFAQAELELFQEIADELGLIELEEGRLWCRHPLAYLMEAADDICYRVADLEDGVTMECVSLSQVEEHLAPLAWCQKKPELSAKEAGKELLSMDWYKVKPTQEKLGLLRSLSIGNLVSATVDAFMAHHDDLLSGNFNDELLAKTPMAESAEACKKFAGESIFGSRRKLEIETASFEILAVLLDHFVAAMIDYEACKGDLKQMHPHKRRIFKLIEPQPKLMLSRYDNLLQVTDFVSGLSDRSALNLFDTFKAQGL